MKNSTKIYFQNAFLKIFLRFFLTEIFNIEVKLALLNNQRWNLVKNHHQNFLSSLRIKFQNNQKLVKI